MSYGPFFVYKVRVQFSLSGTIYEYTLLSQSHEFSGLPQVWVHSSARNDYIAIQVISWEPLGPNEVPPRTLCFARHPGRNF